jgi:predicted porin
MKKTLVAIAALAATGAFAQSAVTITGTVDVGYNAYKATNDTANIIGTTTANDEIKTTTYGANKSSTPGALTSNRIIIAGTEDLGGGRSAGFTYEMPLNYATGASGLGGTARQSHINVADKTLGTVSLGRQYSPIFSAGAAFDAGGANNMSAGRTVYGKHTLVYAPTVDAKTTITAPDSFTRVDSSVMYTSPTMSGVTVKLMTGKNTTTTDGAQAAAAGSGAAASRVDRGMSIAYANGPLAAQVATHYYENQATAGMSTKATVAGASYDFGVAKLMASMNDSKSEASGAQTNSYKGTQYGVTAPFGAFSAFATYGKGKSDSTASVRAYDFKGTQAGLSYALSKRTNVYAAMGSETQTEVSTSKDLKIKETAVGVRHSF